jgi:hypothetical protein
MRRTTGTRLATLAAVSLTAVLATAPAAQAAYYNTYSDIADAPDVGAYTGAQGFAAGATYLYSIKTRTSNDDDRSLIYRANRSGGSATLMSNATDGTSSNAWLGHANDMTITASGGTNYFWVVTMESSGPQLVKLSYDGTSYRKVGGFGVRLNGAVKTVSGISRVAVTSSTTSFLFKSGSTVYRGSIGTGATSGTVDLAPAFTLQTSGALVNGAPVSDIEDFAEQGFYYDESRDVLYRPLTKENRSIVLVYPDVTTSTQTPRKADPDLSFRITSSAYTKFEVEGVGVSSGDRKLYFNTNRNGDKDGFHAFKGYVAP